MSVAAMEDVGDYTFDKKDLIGHGAFAVVFKGSLKKDASIEVAIKSISKKNLSKTQTLLGKEIKILKELHHENIVQLLDCVETQTSVHLIMEFCNGGDLADYLQAKGTLSEDTIRFFLRQIAAAMRALNEKGIVHRDLKPQNILLSHSSSVKSPTPSDIRIKIADFGFARFLHGEMMAATLCGSPMYMAPEVIMSKPYDSKADLWSLGTIIYQCLTGKAPFQASNPQNLRKLYESSKMLKPSIPDGCSPLMKDLLFGLLRRHPKERINFEDLFNHPFLTGKQAVTQQSTPVAVPSRRRVFSECSRGIRSPMEFQSSSPTSEGSSAVNRHSPGIGRYSPHSLPCGYQRRHPTESGSSMPDDFVLVPYDIKCESPSSRSHRRMNKDGRFSPAESSSPKSRIEIGSGRTMFMIGSPSSSPTHPELQAVLDRTISNTSPQSTLTSPLGSPSKPKLSSPRSRDLRTPSPLFREQVTPPQLLRRTSSNLKVSTPPSLESVSDSAEMQHVDHQCDCNRSSKESSPAGSVTKMRPSSLSSKRRVTYSQGELLRVDKPYRTRRPRRTTISNAADPMSELAQLNFTSNQRGLINIWESSKPAGFQAVTRTASSSQKEAVHMRKLDRNVSDTSLTTRHHSHADHHNIVRANSSPALLSEAVKNLPVQANQLVNFTDRIAALLKQLAQDNFQTDVLSQLPSPQFRLLSSPTSPNLFSGDATPPPGSFQASPASLKGQESRKSSVGSRHGSLDSGPRSRSNSGTFKTVLSSPDVITCHGSRITHGFYQFAGSPKYDQPAIVRALSEEFGKDLSLEPIPLHSNELSEETLLPREHTVAMEELEFLSLYAEAILNLTSDENLWNCVSDIISDQKARTVVPTVAGITCFKLLLAFEGLRVSSYAMKVAQSRKKKGTLHPTKALKSMVTQLKHTCERAMAETQLYRNMVDTKDVSKHKADTAKLIYLSGVGVCQLAASNELMGNLHQAKNYYQLSSTLFSGMIQLTRSTTDKAKLAQCIFFYDLMAQISLDYPYDQMARALIDML